MSRLMDSHDMCQLCAAQTKTRGIVASQSIDRWFCINIKDCSVRAHLGALSIFYSSLVEGHFFHKVIAWM